MKKIIFILPYFGTWPFWFDYFLLTCRHNASINWLILGDSPPPADAPQNVAFQTLSFEEYSSFVSDKLDVSFSPTRPYKLCDLKPMYGFIHEADIVGYDFWGFCDMDVVFGELRDFLTEDVLAHDAIFTHARRVSGHCSLFRTERKLIDAFQQLSDWRELLESPDNQRLDERAFSKLFYRHKNWPLKMQTLLPGGNPLRISPYFEEQHSTPGCRIPWLDGSQEFPNEWRWREGKLTNDLESRGFMYFHFLNWKQEFWKKGYRAEGGHLEKGEAVCDPVSPSTLEFKINRSGFIVPN
ncbi:hypothetical protein SAMN05216421_0342 [Halopseudomonas xinjiangensis]|uniref:Uncharacterized protein n=1 Tax=Halopseudomonas xinjiangensis TaxID=487184 RepID=A0A1H1M1E0_9GAMM|nr:DUF6625 family protein [Halopseudomonas xinjiangensis]SDR80292.1 hypothetical protein SAMN05216421_0342 [Halopseudomonas xinjiangensis]